MTPQTILKAEAKAAFKLDLSPEVRGDDAAKDAEDANELSPEVRGDSLEVIGDDAAIFTAEAKAAFKSRPELDPTDFTDPKYQSAVYKGKSFLSGDLDLWHRRMRHVSKERLKQVSAHGIIDGF